MAGEFIGYGATLGYSDTINGTYVTLAGLLDVDPNELKMGEVKTTAHDSPNYAHTYSPGMIEPGEISVKAHFKRAVYTTLYNLFKGRTKKFWQITVNDVATPSKWQCEGFLSSMKVMTPMEENCEDDLKIKLSGLPVFTEGS